MRRWIAVWVGALSSLLACDRLAWAQTPSLADLDSQYLQSVQQASPDPTSLPINVDLTTISKDAGQVQMTIFTNYTGYNRQYNENTNPALWHPDLFSTAGHELYDRIRQMSPGQAALQTKQLLGLPPGSNYDRVVEYWTDAGKLFRPAYDSNIENPHPSNTFNPADPKADWFLHHWNAWNPQTGSFTYSNLKNYPPAYDFSSYTDSSGNVHTSWPYPWTRLGYTYNWANMNSSDPNAIVGLSEFITPHHWAPPTPGDADDDPIAVQAVVSIGSYMYYERNTGNFDVSGACDTIWAGDLYTPVNPSAGQSSWIHVRAGAAVAQGITVSSPGFVLVNEGTILGPGKNLDNTYRDNAVEFVRGGALLNSGLIAGTGVGVSIGGAAGENSAVDNSGVIRGSQYSIQAKAGTSGNIAVANSGLLDGSLLLGDGNNSIDNSGTINGSIVTGAGNDSIALRGGRVTGCIDAGAGSNLLEVRPGMGNTALVNGNISNVQAFHVQSGTACFNGQVSASVTIDSGAAITGSGAYGGNLVNQGAIAIGNSTSAIHVNGNYTQGGSGALLVEVSEPYPDALNPGRFTTASQINVTGGGVTIADGAQIVVGQSPGSQGVIRTGDRFTIITAQGGITANPANQHIACDSDFLQFSGATARPADAPCLYQLVAQRTATFASLAQGANRRSLAAAFDADSAMASGDYAGMIDSLLFMRAGQFNQAISQLSPAPYQDGSLATLRTAQYMAESTADYLRRRRNDQDPALATAAAAPQGLGVQYANVSFTPSLATPHTEMMESANSESAGVYSRCGFFDPFGISYGNKSTGDHVGFQANSVGTRFGFDKQAADDLICGLEGGYANSFVSFADARGGGQINTFRVGPYATYYSEAGFCDAAISGGFHTNDFHRDVTAGGATAVGQADYAADDCALYTGVGADWRLDDYTLSPCASLQYIYYHGGSFTETGNGVDSLMVTSQDVPSLRSKVGVRVSRALAFGCGQIVPELFLGWAHEYLADETLNARFTAGAATFATDPGGLFRDAAYFGGGLSLARGSRGAFFLRYTGELCNGGQFNAGDVGFSLGF